MLVPMARVEIIGPKGLFFDVVSMIHDQGRLHIEDLSKKISRGEIPLDRMEIFSGQQKDREQMEEMLIRTRSILKALDRGGSKVDRLAVRVEYERLFEMDPDALSAEISKVIAEVEDRTSALASTHTDLESEIALLSRYEPILQKIQPLARQIVTTGAYDSVALLFERRYKTALDALKEELDRITHKQYEVVSTDVDEDTTAAIVVFSRQYSDAVHKFLAVENINQIRLPNEFDGMPFDAAYDELKSRRSSLPNDLETIRKELDSLSEKWAVKLSAIRDVLIDRNAEIEAIPKFGRTEYAFVITGWMPVSDVPSLRTLISKRWKDDVIVQQTEVKESEYADTPVALKNPKALEPFEFLLSAYGMPRYGTLDPTMFLFIFYPLFFGLMVGDIGYGAVMLGIVIWLRLKFKENAGIQLATSILGPAATAVLAFGFVYGEFFGNIFHTQLASFLSGLSGGVLPFVRTEGEMIKIFMYIAVAVGIVHILLGLIVGVINAVRTKNSHHFQEKTGILTFVVSIGIVVVLTMVAESMGNWAVWGQALFALVALGGFWFAVRGGGVMGVIETVEVFTGMASYIRIMAVGLAGAIFAEAVNGIVADMAKNPAMMVLGALVGLVLHSLNFVIAAFSPTIHAVRLNFVEFFGKFYEIGSQQYKPFTKTGGEEGA
ncbi:MAG TPA: V-type ATPase 116kDa subunit family protein [Coriobacteriia bacterium]|nr:V-type ATPase 116kDa subunit family protein [Coriobacteriia bacterium]